MAGWTNDFPLGVSQRDGGAKDSGARENQRENEGVPKIILKINTKNCSLSIVLTATDQKPQK